MAPRDVGLALLVVLAWGLNFTAIVWSVAEVPPLLLTALRYLALGCLEESGVVDADSSLTGNADEQFLVTRGKLARLGMTEE